MMKKLIIIAVMLSGVTIHGGAKIENQSSSEWTAIVKYDGLYGTGKTITIAIKPGQTQEYEFSGEGGGDHGMVNSKITLVSGGCSREYVYGRKDAVGSFAILHEDQPDTPGMDLNHPSYGDILLRYVPCK